MMILGLTGGIATGKSTVSRYFQQLNIPVCDTDVLAREVVLPNSKGLNQLIETFGNDIINPDGTLNRSQLANIIFHNEQAREKVNTILHPLIFEKIEVFKMKHQSAKLLVIDMPLLFEVGYQNKVDKVMVIYTEKAIQYQHLINRDGFTPQQAKARIIAQMPLKEKVKLADVVIDNSKTVEETFKQVDSYLKRLNL